MAVKSFIREDQGKLETLGSSPNIREYNKVSHFAPVSPTILMRSDTGLDTPVNLTRFRHQELRGL